MEELTAHAAPVTGRTRDLPRTLTIPEAAAILGIGRTLAFSAARTGQIPAIRIGHRLVVPTKRLLAMLGEDFLLPPEEGARATTAQLPTARPR